MGFAMVAEEQADIRDAPLSAAVEVRTVGDRLERLYGPIGRGGFRLAMDVILYYARGGESFERPDEEGPAAS